VDDLLALWEVQRRGAVNARALTPLLQRDSNHAAAVLENLTASGLLRADGQTYRLHPDLHAETGRPAKSTPPDPEVAVLDYVRTHGSIARREVVGLLDLSENQAAYLLKKLVDQGKLHMVGRGRGSR
jgi:predicted HTH transcriptional regulator